MLDYGPLGQFCHVIIGAIHELGSRLKFMNVNQRVTLLIHELFGERNTVYDAEKLINDNQKLRTNQVKDWIS